MSIIPRGAGLAAGAIVALGLLAGAGAAAPPKGAGTVVAKGSPYGKILFDGSNRALYAFTHDQLRKSRCSGACATAWPPYVVSRKPAATKGARASLVGTIKRSDGKLQVTYGGRPLYYYVGDRKPGDVRCQNVNEFGGIWLVVRPGGQLVR